MILIRFITLRLSGSERLLTAVPHSHQTDPASAMGQYGLGETAESDLAGSDQLLVAVAGLEGTG